jgi:hypothetical protein
MSHLLFGFTLIPLHSLFGDCLIAHYNAPHPVVDALVLGSFSPTMPTSSPMAVTKSSNAFFDPKHDPVLVCLSINLQVGKYDLSGDFSESKRFNHQIRYL